MRKHLARTRGLAVNVRLLVVVAATTVSLFGAVGTAGAAEQCTPSTGTCIELTAKPNPVGTSSADETKYLSVIATVTAKALAVGQTSVVADLGEITGAGDFYSATASHGACTVAADTVSCGLGHMGVGETKTVYVALESPTAPGTITIPDGAFSLSVNERAADNPARDPRVDTVGADGTSAEATDSNELTWVPAFTPVTIWAGDPNAVAPSCVNKASKNDPGDCAPLSTVNDPAGAVPSTQQQRAASALPTAPVGPNLNNLQNGSASIPSNTGQYQARFLECSPGDANTDTTCTDLVTVCPFLPSSPAFVNCARAGSTWDAKIAYPGPQVSCAAGSGYQCAGPLRFDLQWDPSLIPPGQTGDVCTRNASGAWSCQQGNFGLFHFPEPAVGTVAQPSVSQLVTRRCSGPSPTSITAKCIWNPHFDPQTGYFTVSFFSNENGRMR